MVYQKYNEQGTFDDLWDFSFGEFLGTLLKYFYICAMITCIFMCMVQCGKYLNDFDARTPSFHKVPNTYQYNNNYYQDDTEYYQNNSY